MKNLTAAQRKALAQFTEPGCWVILSVITGSVRMALIGHGLIVTPNSTHFCLTEKAEKILFG